MNRTGSKILHGLLLATSGLVGSTIIASTAAMAGGPTGGHVAVGSATIVNASPTQTVINQSSKKALINWNSFSVSSGSSVQFNQPNSKSLTVNRVTGADASVINGSLRANGNVWLLNANGVLFGKGSQVNVGSLLATTSDISDDDFKNGNYTFKPSANGNASVVNKGTITVGQGGSVVLSAPQVSNEGVIQANLGTVVLGGAKAFTVDMTGDNLLTYQITEPVSDAPKSANGSVANALVSNSGTIMAAGGHVLMTARAARNVEDNVINNTGMVEATTVSSHNGVIDLDAGPNGTVNAGGTLDVSGTQSGKTGGTITATGGTVNVADGAKLNASGDAGGGTVLIGGDAHGQGTLAHAQRTVIGKATITADATTKGDGGKVVVWSGGDTSFDGSISARGGVKGGNGGFVETSGHNLGVTANATVNTLAPVGLSGDWLLDPVNITIGSCGSTSYDPNQSGDESIANTAITNGLASGNMILEATSNITLNTGASINYAGSNTLSLLAEGNITLGSDIQFSGSGAINLVAGWDGQTTDLSSLGGSVYGNNGGSITIGDSAHIGSASGKTTLAGDNLIVGSTNKAIQAQIGYNGEGSGDIAILLTGDLTVNFGTYSSTFQIGNYNPNGNASGDVNIAVGGNAQITQANGTIVVGNTATNGTVTGSLTFAAGSITEDHNVLENNVAADLPGGDVTVNVYGSSLSFNGATYNSSHNLTLYSNGALAINSAIQNAGTGGINLSSYSDGLTINAPVSTLGSVAVDTLTAGASITLNSDIVVGGSLGLNACGSVVQSGGSIQASDLSVTTTGAGHSITLGSIGNEISGTIVLSTPSDATIANGQTTTLGAITVGGLLNVSVTDPSQSNDHSALMLTGAVDVSGSGDTVIHATGDIINLDGQSLITADALNLISDYGSIGAPEPNDPNTSYFISTSINSLHAQTGGGNLLFTSSKSYSVGTDLGGIDTGGGSAFIAASAGAITQSATGTIVAGDLDVSVGEGGFVLSNPGNEISGSLSVNTTGTGLFASSSDIHLRGISGSGFIDDSSSAGTVTVETQGNLTVVSGGTFNLSGDISLLAAKDLEVETTLQNSGAGNITLVAGWNDQATDPTEADAYGFNSQGNVTVSGDNVSVGSASGSVLVEGYNVSVEADGGYAQIGYNSGGAGNITVNAQNDVMLYASDDDECDACYAQIGNGGYDISANASGNITINTGDYVSLNGGAFDTSYAQIGNGGYSFDGTIGGDVSIQSGGRVTLTGGEGYAQIGNGGAEASGVISGDLWVNAGISAYPQDDQIELSAGSGGYAQIGNGGDSSSSTNSGNIFVSTTGTISIVGDGDYAQIGNGGWETTGGGDGDITVSAGQGLTIKAYGYYAQIGNGGGGENAHGGTGDIAVTSNGSIVLDGSGYGAYAKIGNGGNSTTDDAVGDITVKTIGDLTLTGGEGSSQIGNGGFGFEGNVSGDIAITVGGETSIDQSGWIGNYTDTDDWTASGDVSIVMQSGYISGDFLNADLQNGNLLLGWTGGPIEWDGFDYNSSHTFTVLSAGNVAVLGDIQNSGSGAINLVAGWDGHTTDLSLLTNSGVYGNSGSMVTIGGPDPETSVAVGSKGGATNILTGDLLVSAKDGNAQLGYFGQGSGNINVYATGDVTVQSVGDWVALIGNGNAAASGSIGGNINITTQSGAVTVESAADDSLAMIGNLGGAGSSQSGSTTINTHGGALTLVADNPGEENIGYAHIGNLTFGDTTGTSSGNIIINAGTMMIKATSDASFADIGNGSFHAGSDTGALSGNININATTLSLVSDASGGTAQARIGHLGMGSVSGDINIATTGALSLVGNNLGLSSIGSVSAPMDTYSNLVQGAGSGNINIQSGAVTLASQNGGHARIESGGFTSGNINVAATGNISLTANGSFAGIGAFQSGNGTVNVSVTSTGGGISLRASGTKGEAQIGNAANGASGKIGGSLNVSAANATRGNITISASGVGSVALIGATGYGDTVTGNIGVLAGNKLLITGGSALTATPGGGVSGTLAQIGDTNVDLSNAAASGTYSSNVVITAKSLDGIGGSVFNDLVGGDVTVSSLGTGVLEIDDTHGYSSSHNFLLNTGGDLLLESSLQNSSSGNLTFVSAGNVTIGGSGASGSVSVGSRSGATSVTAKNLLVSAVQGNAQLGYAGAGTGAIKVNTTGNVTVQTASNNTVALIGNGGYGLTGALKGDISIAAGGNVIVRTNSSSAIADIGVIGGDGSSQSGNITITAGGQVGVIAQNATSSAQIGNQQAGATTPSQRGAASGNIAIISGSVLISATGTNAGAIIGMGNTLLRNQSAAGSTIVNTGDLTISSSSTTSTGTVAMLGSRGYNSANSNIAVTASGNVSLVAGNYGNALLGQGSYGTAAGDLVVASGKTLSLNASGASSQARVGNSGVNASGNITAAASGAVTIAKASGATSLIGGSATGGTLTGNVIVLAGTAQGIAASIANDIIGGDFTLYALNSGTLDVGSVGSYSSSHDLYILAADNLAVSGSIQNSGAGNVTLAAGHTLTVGGSTASGNVAVGSKGGLTEIEATDLLLSATNGYAQIGYHGGGSGAIDVIALGNITISGGGSTGYYAQIGDGGYGVTGSSSAPISVTATSNIALNGGAGQEAYAQIGNGGAESNSNTSGYGETGDIVVSNSGAMTLNAGTGQGSYVQIGNGGYLSGQSLNGTVAVGGNISVTTYSALGLTGGGDDAYVQIGNGGDFLNKNVADGSSGTISGDIAVAVQAPNVPGLDQLTLTAGTGANSYTQIGNGGQGENKPAAGAKVSFTISGNVTVADLTLSGSNTGANGYAQIGNGDASRTGTGNITGSVTLGQGTKLTYDPGKAPGASSGFGNATGQGSVSGTVASSGVDASTQGSVASITQTSTNSTTAFSVTPETASPTYVQQLASIDTIDNTKGPSPLEQLSDNSEQTTVSDTVADSVGKSLGEGKTIAVSTKMLIPGLLKQFVTLTPNQPHGVPPADVDYSSWGNEALWRW